MRVIFADAVLDSVRGVSAAHVDRDSVVVRLLCGLRLELDVRRQSLKKIDCAPAGFEEHSYYRAEVDTKTPRSLWPKRQICFSFFSRTYIERKFRA